MWLWVITATTLRPDMVLESKGNWWSLKSGTTERKGTKEESNMLLEAGVVDHIRGFTRSWDFLRVLRQFSWLKGQKATQNILRHFRKVSCHLHIKRGNQLEGNLLGNPPCQGVKWYNPKDQSRMMCSGCTTRQPFNYCLYSATGSAHIHTCMILIIRSHCLNALNIL